MNLAYNCELPELFVKHLFRVTRLLKIAQFVGNLAKISKLKINVQRIYTQLVLNVMISAAHHVLNCLV
jgi:hypothetical protein